jgi:hypothetical protein
VLTYGAWWAFSVLGGYPGVGIQDRPISDARSFADFLHVVSRDWFKLIRKHWFGQFWGDFANVNTPFPGWVHVVIVIAVVAGIGLLLAWMVVLWRERQPTDNDIAAFVFVAALVFTIGALYVLLWDYFRRVGADDLIQGRYALMLVPAVLSLPALCVQRIAPRLDPAVTLVPIAASMAILNALGLTLLIAHFYV